MYIKRSAPQGHTEVTHPPSNPMEIFQCLIDSALKYSLFKKRKKGKKRVFQSLEEHSFIPYFLIVLGQEYFNKKV